MDRVTKAAAAVLKELKKQKGEGGPKGLPTQQANRDETNSDYPTAHLEPKDPGFTLPGIIAGSGDGPVIGSEDSQYSGV